ncbi:MAG: hypothetical protein WCA12_02730 [Burkholderiales bacterium]
MNHGPTNVLSRPVISGVITASGMLAEARLAEYIRRRLKQRELAGEYHRQRLDATIASWRRRARIAFPAVG